MSHHPELLVITDHLTGVIGGGDKSVATPLPPIVLQNVDAATGAAVAHALCIQAVGNAFGYNNLEVGAQRGSMDEMISKHCPK